MPLTWTEINSRALAFSREWANEASERAEAQTFWNEFFQVFGVVRRRVAIYEKTVARLKHGDKASGGRIDVFWPGLMLAEHKSAGADLDAAFQQAADYFEGLSDKELPRFVVVSDFRRLRLYDLEEDTRHDFVLKDFHRHIHRFGFIAGYQRQKVREQDPINVEAVQKMGDLHDALKQDGYAGHALEVFLVRLLFCLFADDTGIFNPKGSFRDLIERYTSEDGANVGDELHRLFVVVNTLENKRQKSLPEQFRFFPYVNGKLFEEKLDPPTFNADMRGMLLALCDLRWGAISPAIFGAMFQSVIELDARDRRRQLGAHYTSEVNIMKLIGPLFLDELRVELEKARLNKNKLFEFQKKLQRLTFLDPACGCGNFLVISYRELRRLEIEVLVAAEKFGPRIGSVFESVVVDVDQFYGIEVEEFPAQVAQVAMWLMDHQMNIEASEVFGVPLLRIPLVKSANIRLGNALRIDWAEFVPPTKLNYILGNPPFVGKKERDAAQKNDLATVAEGIAGAGVLDYVAGWYVKAARYATAEADSFGNIVDRASAGRRQFRDVRFGKGAAAAGDLFLAGAEIELRARRVMKCAFVSTNSITQGEQVGVLWGWLLAQGIHIHFAHRTFQWTNEAPGKAAVHCVIIGFAAHEPAKRRLFEYENVKGEPHEVAVASLNPYLVDGPEIVLQKRANPICRIPSIMEGSALIDDGHLVLSEQDASKLLADFPEAAPYVRPLVWGDGFINGERRFCLWLAGAPAAEVSRIEPIRQRVTATRAFRVASGRAATRALAATPAVFGEIRQPRSRYLFVPKTSSERRNFIPIGFLSADHVINNTSLFVERATLYHFGVLTSTIHNVWVRYVAGRLESRYRYSNQIVYNNFPWPSEPSEAHLAGIESAAQSVLGAREAEFVRDPATTLAVLYDPNTMPPALARAHQVLDRAVDAAYLPDGGKRKWASDAERVAFLFTLYQKYTSLLPAEVAKVKRVRKSK